MLEVKDLRVNYGKVQAVRDISFTVQAGEIVSIVGPNGAGKTSAINAVFGITPSRGFVGFEGQSIAGLSPEKVVRHSLRLVPEGRHIFSSLTVAENLAVGLAARRDRQGSRRDLDALMDRFEVLRRYQDTHAGKLSGGEQQQLAIARALLGRPRLLALDEPSLGLAPALVDSVMELLKELREDGVTVLLVEQNAMRAVEMADRSYVVRSGEVVMTGSRSEILAKTDFAAQFLGLGT